MVLHNILNWVLRTHPGRLSLLILLSVVVRLILYRDFPILLTNDSWDYMTAARDIYQRADFYSDGLRDLRLPGYPTLLALTYPLTQMRSDSIVLLQSIIGLACVLLGWAIGYMLRSQPVVEALVLFLGLNPAYLLNEHALMIEAFFLFALLSFVAVAIDCLRGWNWPKGAGLGLTFGLCVLTRANALPFCAALAAGIIGVRLVQHRSAWRSPAVRRNFVGFVIAASITAALVIGPWLWRNYTLFGNVALLNYTNRGLLTFKFLHHRLDTSLPILSEVNDALSTSKVDFDWLWKLATAYPTLEAERIAGEIVWEQIVHHPDRHIQDVLESFVGFGGYHGRVRNDRAAMMFWFDTLVSNLSLLNETNTPAVAKSAYPEFVYAPAAGDTLVTRLWSKMGVAFLGTVRPLLYLAFFVAGAIYFVRHRTAAFTTVDLSPLAIAVCSMAYFTLVVFHAVTLTDSDRYAVPFDWILLMVVLLIVAGRLAHKRGIDENQILANAT
jgi:hypothetical protein